MALEAEMTRLRQAADDGDALHLAQMAEVIARLAEAANDSAGVDAMRGIVLDQAQACEATAKLRSEEKEKREQRDKEEKDWKEGEGAEGEAPARGRTREPDRRGAA